MKEIKHEIMRSGIMSFQKDFSDYLISNHKDHWKPSNCTFFRDNGKMKAWAFCSFER